MQKLREEKHMMSVNQLSVYHTLIETYNVVNKGSSKKIRDKMMNSGQEVAYTLRSRANGDLIVPHKTRLDSQGFSYLAAKLYNKVPKKIRDSKEAPFKALVKNWIWENIPSK